MLDVSDGNNIRILHRNILEIAKYYHDFCSEHGLKYSLLGGTALGAMRHKGFIPWDDDFDVCMPIKDYYRFLALSDAFETSAFYIQKERSKGLPLYFSKVRLKESVYLDEGESSDNPCRGIYIDVMCLVDCSDNPIARFLQYLVSRALTSVALYERGYSYRQNIKKILFTIGSMAFVYGLGERNLIMFARPSDLHYDSIKYYGHFAGRARYNNALVEKIWFINTASVTFEGCEFHVMERIHDYLKRRFGDSFMEIPGYDVKAKYPIHCKGFEPNPQFIEPLP